MPSANLAEKPKFEDIIIAVHGIGAQHRFETVRSVANRLASSKRLLGDAKSFPVAPQPLGYFHSDVTRLSSVCLLDDRQALNVDLASIGFAEVFWADIPQDVAKEGRTLEETKAWARTVMARARALYQQAEREQRPGIIRPDFGLAAEVLDEIIDTVHVLENLCSIASKAGVFRFDLRDILVEYIGDVQLVTEFGEHRTEILRRFDEAITNIYNDYCEKDPKVRIHIVAHSEGTVISFLAMLNAMQGRTFALDKSSPPRAIPVNGAIPPWLSRVKGFMTIGSPIDKHLLLWPRLWNELTPEKANNLFQSEKIRWRNYYDYGDPVGFKLDTARLWLREKHCSAFEFCGCPQCHHDIGFARYLLPGEAHNEYWNDSDVFEHFINAVVRTGTVPVVPKSKPVVEWLSPLLPYLLSILLLILGVFIAYRAIHTYTHPSYDPLQKLVRFTQLGIRPPPDPSLWETLCISMGSASLIAGGTLLARLPRLAVGPCWRTPQAHRLMKHFARYPRLVSSLNWKIAGIGAFMVGSILYYILVPPKIRVEMGHSFGHPTLAILLITAIASLSGYLATSNWGANSDRKSRWFRTGMRPLIICGSIAFAAIIALEVMPRRIDATTFADIGVASIDDEAIKTIKESGLSADELKQVYSVRGPDWIATLKKVGPVLAAHPPTWPVLISGIAFLYLWWLSALVFDLAFVWQRYVRHSVTNDRLLEWNPFGFEWRTEHGEAQSTMHHEPGA
jgi:hypothetical protein